MSDKRRSKPAEAVATCSPARRRPASGRDNAKPIDPSFRPMPNGWKISIGLEECGLPCEVRPANIGIGDQFKRYLCRETGKFYPASERSRVEVDQWLFWQMAGLGPMAGQAHHFRQYAQENIPYAIKPYTDEVNRLHGAMNKRLKDRDYLTVVTRSPIWPAGPGSYPIRTRVSGLTISHS